jgi:tetratricopeptide (TPR) repeat protein
MNWTRRKIWIAGAVLALALGAGGWWWETRPAHIQAIVVKPFSGEAPLAEPLRAEVLDFLARIPGLSIVSQPAAPPAVTGVLEARVERSADRVRIVAELSRADGHRYWTRTIDRPAADLPGAAEDVAAAVNGKARRKKPPKSKPVAAAYEAYLDGRFRFDRGDFPSAISRLEDATRLDATFARAWAWLSIAKHYQADSGAVRPNLALPEARDAADRAAALDPDAAESHLALGISDLQYDWHWNDAKSELDRALRISPGWKLAADWRERWNQAMGHGPEPQFHFANVPEVQDEAQARKLLEDADDIRVETYISAAALALVANRLHDTDSTFRWLDQAYDERCVQLPYILWDPSLPHDDPRFEDLKRRMKLGGAE